MVEYASTHEVYYETSDLISVSDVVESLLGIEELFQSSVPFLEACFPGLNVERVQISIKDISEGSLKEIVYTALFATYQKDLEEELPKFLESIAGISVGHKYPTITAIVFLLLLFYAADTAYKKIGAVAGVNHLKERVEGFIKELCSEFSLKEERVRAILEAEFGKGSRLRSIWRASARVFRPAKRHGNSAIRVGDHRIEPHIVAQVPGDAQMLELTERPEARPLENVEIELHAQDMDRTKRGWAAVIPELSSQRVRMELYPPITPADIYTKSKIRGDVLAMFSENSKGENVPIVYHLMRIKDQPTESPPSPAQPTPPEKM